MTYSLEVKEPKICEGLSSMHFTVKKWREIALSDSEQKLEQYVKTLDDSVVYRIVERYGAK